jgi:hypothetical protein
VTGYLIAGAALVHATVLPLAWKWQLGILRVALVVLAGSMIAAIIVAARLAPRSDDFIVSPADGQVIYVREIQPGRIPVAEKRAGPIRSGNYGKPSSRTGARWRLAFR